MICFFHPREEINAENGCLSWYSGKIQSIQMKENRKTEDFCEIYRLLYDMADYIYEKRFDSGCQDEELLRFVNETSVPKTEDDEAAGKLRLKALEKLIRELDQEAPDHWDTSEQLLQIILFFLVKGKICLRISEYYIEYYDFSASDRSGKEAQALLWRAKQLGSDWSRKLKAERQELPPEKRTDWEVHAGEKTDEYLICMGLVKLNLAKYHRDYGRKNRRSDFDAALDEYYHICKKSREQFSCFGQDRKRQSALIWLDAVSDISYIHRSRNWVELAHKEAVFVYCELKKALEHCGASRDRRIRSVIEHADKLLLTDMEYWKTNSAAAASLNSVWKDSVIDREKLERELAEEDQVQFFLKDFEQFIREGILTSGEHSTVLPFDLSHFFMLTLNELSVIRALLHCTEEYDAAVNTAILANEWAGIMDGSPEPSRKEKHSIDAVNNMSHSLRKYFKFKQEPMMHAIGSRCYVSAATLGQQVKDLLKLLFEFAEGNYTSRSELIKWYCLSREMPVALGKEIRRMSRQEDETHTLSYWNILEKFFPELTREIEPEDNIQNLFLCGMLLYRLCAYSDAVRYFDAVLLHREAGYIRVASLGTKTRFLKACCLLSLGKCKDAEMILLNIREEMNVSYKSKGDAVLPSGTSSRYQDERVESMLAYCYMAGGNYSRARAIYEELFGYMLQQKVMGRSGQKQETERKSRTEYRRLKPSRQVHGLCNLAECLLFEGAHTAESDRLGITYTVDHLLACIEDVEELRKSQRDQTLNKKPELIRGYQCLLFTEIPKGAPGTEKKIRMLRKALGYFSEACNKGYGFYSLSDHFIERYENDRFSPRRSEMLRRERVEAFSAYLITLTEISNLITDRSSLTEKDRMEAEQMEEVSILKKIILSLPETMEVSMKAAFSLAGWLLRYEKWAAEKKKSTLVPQLFRSFSYLTVYSERGARAFNELKEERGFRFYSPEQRGKILAHLLLFYEPIKRIKEEYCLGHGDKPEDIHLYHYTTIDTLKILLSEREDTPARLRIYNCGFMNDQTEGNTFIKMLEQVYTEKYADRRKTWKDLQEGYYPQMDRSTDQMMPNSSDVYVACVSVRQDSFPMWSIYGDHEYGCNIEFDANFFQISGSNCRPEKLRKYKMSQYTDEDYPLYKVHYLSGQNLKEYRTASRKNTDCGEILSDEPKKNGAEENTLRFVKQSCGTWVPEIAELNRCIEFLTERLVELDQFLEGIYGEERGELSGELSGLNDPRESLRRFAANRLDEIRFLFKNSDYSYESEIRTVYTVSSGKEAETRPKIDLQAEVPCVYVEMNRDIRNVSVTLGSLIKDAEINKYVTWLKQTGKVKNVRLAVTNRKMI